MTEPAPMEVDTESALELLKEATKLISSTELERMGVELERKMERFAAHLSPTALPDLTLDALHEVAGLVFTVRSKRRRLRQGLPIEGHREAIGDLLYGTDDLGVRFDRFIGVYHFLDAHPHRARTLASELLHYTDPSRYWLWTSWIWEPATAKGALRLVSDLDLSGRSHGEIYQKVGHVTAIVASDGRNQGYTRLGRGLLGTDVFLACVAAISMFTLYKYRISQEFLRFLPEFQETARRLLGVQHLAGEL